MASGDYDRRIGIELNTKTEDAFKQKISGWSNVGNIWAKIEYGSGAERRVAVAQEQSTSMASLEVRKSPLTANMKAGKHRLTFDDAVWDIESIAPGDGRDRNKKFVIIATAKT